MALRNWITDEVAEARPLLQSVAGIVSGVVTGRLAQASDFLDRLERGEIKAAYDAVTDWCDELDNEIKEGVYSQPLEAKLAADGSLWRLEQQVRELYRIRTFVDRFMSESEAGDETPDDD